VAKSNVAWRKAHGIARLSILAIALVVAWSCHVRAGTYTTDLTFCQGDLRFSNVKGYHVVTLRGARWLNRPGKPLLPLVPVRIALPAGCEVTDLALGGEDSLELVGDFLVLPSQPPLSLSSDRLPEFVEPLASVYTSDELYPERAGELVGWGRLGGAIVCDVLVYPLRYRPSERKLILFTELRLTVEYQWQVPMSCEKASASGVDLLRSLVTNGQDRWKMTERRMHDGSPLIIGGETIPYLIITCDSLRVCFEPLKDWKTRKGLPAEIVTVETISMMYAGLDLQEKVRNCIKDYHSKSGTDWVLLGGDTQVIPDRKAYVPLSDKPYLPCDLYYSDLDGTWNADGDLYWGEVPSDNIDMYADVFVGRAPVSDAAEAAIFVEKVLTYEGCHGLSLDYQLDVLFAGEILWGDPSDPSDPDYTDAGVCKDLIDSLYVPSRFSIEKLYESKGTLTYGSLMSQLNQGKNIINILCHGQYKSMSLAEDAVACDDFESLVNGPSYGLMYGVTCFSGGFDQNDCIGEAWVLSAEGGGFFIGNSRYGWNSPSFPGEGPSDYYDQSFFEAVFNTGFTNLAKAHADAKHEYVGESRADLYMRYVMYGLNLLGDPELRLWTREPAHMDVTFDHTLTTGPQTFVVGVTSGGSPVAGASVCLHKPGDIYCVDETAGDGEVNMFVDPGDSGKLYVTVTKADHLPFLGEAVVQDLTHVPVEGGDGRYIVVSPNPFKRSVTFVVNGRSATPPDIDVFDVGGRWIDSVPPERRGGGGWGGRWYAREASGRKLPPGIYLVRFTFGGKTTTRKLILLN
jgi:hypothetical protein